MKKSSSKSEADKGGSRHRGLVRRRTTWLFLVFALIYVGIAGRLAYIQVYHSDYYRTKAARIRLRERLIPASRGTIFDRKGRPLAVNIETASVFANTKEVTDLPGTAVRVAALLGEKPSIVEQRLSSRKPGFMWLGRQLDAGIEDRLHKLKIKLPGIGVQNDTKRVYPLGPLAAQIIGFANIDNKGAEGLESVLEKELTGRDGIYTAELDSQRRPIPATRHQIRKPLNGKNVYLTIDVTIQHIAEQALVHMAKTYSPSSATAIVMNPRTGEILALANYPSYDANKARSVKPELWRNRAVADLYEPGSTLKAVTVAGALNEGISAHVPMAYCTGKEKMRGGRIPCVLHQPYISGHGAADMFRIIEYSCNIGAAHVALKLGPKRLQHYEKVFGLFERPDAGFGCEAVGLKLPEEEWQRPIRIANVGFGQGMAVSALQMAGAYATIANDGVRVRPTIIREIRDSEGEIVQPFKPRVAGRAISASAARELTRMLRSCVDKGTGKPAQIEGRTVAGKTGSAQIARSDGRGYEAGSFVASFMGFVPANKPQIAIVVVVHRPKNSHWGATVAAPVFKEIGEKALWYLKVPADAKMSPGIKPKPGLDRKKMV